MKTLKSKVRKDLKETLYKNKTYQKTRWYFPEGNIIRWSTFYRAYTLLISALFLGISLCLSLWFKFKYENDYSILFTNWGKLLDWQGTILGGQLTIIAIVYPLVVGFLSIFFNNKHSNSVIFPIYKKYSGFMFAGLSGIALSLFLLLGFFLQSILDDIDYLAYCLSSVIWFAFNILLTAWFFTKTFKILNDATRERIVKRFSVQVACHIDVSQRLKKNIIKNSYYYGLTKEQDKETLEIISFSWDSDDTYKISIKLDDDYEISNINFSRINFCIACQTFLLKKAKIKGCKLVLESGYSSDNYFILAKCKNFKFNILLECIFKSSFSFKKSTLKDNDEDLLKNFDTFIEPAFLALKDNDFRAFSKAIDSIANYHTDIAETLSFINDNDEPDNWLLLSTGEIFARTYYSHLMQEYYILAQQSVEKINTSPSFYKEILYLYKKLYGYRTSLTNLEITSLIQESYQMWVILLKWRSFELQSNIKSINNYEDILHTFVSSWESWTIHYIEYKSKRTYDDSQKLLAFTTHIQFTACTIISALSFGNTQAISWGIDMLNNWLEGFSNRDYSNEEYYWNSNIINYFLLDYDKSGKYWLPILNQSHFSSEVAYELAFKNLHLDLRVLTACYFLSNPEKIDKKNTKLYISALLKGERLHPTGSILRNTTTITNAGELLGTFIRHRDYPFYGEKSYGVWLNNIIEKYSDMFKDSFITGRTYMGSVENLRSLEKSYIEIALSLSKYKWDLPRKWYSSISSGFYRHQDIESIISDLNSWKQTVNNQFDDFYDFILIEKEDFPLLKENFIQSLDLIISQLQYKNDQAIIDAAIDQNRLKEMGTVASYIFTNKVTPFPMNCFNSLEVKLGLPNRNPTGTFLISNYSKKYIAENIEKSTISNEDDWIKDGISNNVKNTILAKTFGLPETFSNSFNSINELINTVLNQSKTIPAPILFAANTNIKSFLRSLRWEKSESQSDFISYIEDANNEYICNIGNCEVYSVPFSDIDYCLLTTKEIFDNLVFYGIDNDQFVKTTYELDSPDSVEGCLIFKYWLDINFKDGLPIYKLDLNISQENLVE